MALTKCSECGKEVSEKAVTCPNCGNPINDHIATVELTSKRWKKIKLTAFLCFLFGLFLLPLKGGVAALGILLWMLAFVLVIIGSVGAWWTNR